MAKILKMAREARLNISLLSKKMDIYIVLQIEKNVYCQYSIIAYFKVGLDY